VSQAEQPSVEKFWPCANRNRSFISGAASAGISQEIGVDDADPATLILGCSG